MSFLPIFVDLATGHIVLVGAGAEAAAKLHLLRAAGARVRWFVPDESSAIRALSARHYAGPIEVVQGEPRDVDLSQAIAVVIAAGDPVDARLAARARALGVAVNVVDRPDLSTFIFPAIVNRGDVTVAIGTAGASPVLARRIRERIEAILPARVGELAALMKRYRPELAALRKRLPQFSPRLFWERVADGPIGALLLSGRAHEAEQALRQDLTTGLGGMVSVPGVVHLVGAGPGDPDLLTLRALHAVQNADIIFYDHLVTREILDRARRDAECVFVGKRKGKPGIGQDEINRRMVEAARSGRKVVRLKSGDPFVFGRGGEELAYLRAAGIPTVVVPGITAALGCAAEAGLPLTFRKEATQLSFVTASTADDTQHVDWAGLADAKATVVVYMGLSAADAVRAKLTAAGRSPHTPAAVLARGTRSGSQALVGRLDELPRLAEAAGSGPALLVIGEVAARAENATPLSEAHERSVPFGEGRGGAPIVLGSKLRGAV